MYCISLKKKLIWPCETFFVHLERDIAQIDKNKENETSEFKVILSSV